MKMEYFPAGGGTALVFNDTGSRLLVTEAEGLSEAGVEPVTVSSPGQYGETATDIKVGPRAITLSIAYAGNGYGEAVAQRRLVARAFFSPPPRRGDAPAMALLRCYPQDLPPVELQVIPSHGPAVEEVGPGAWRAEVELTAPYPYWRETSERVDALQLQGGWTLPMTFPIALAPYEAQAVVTNTGNVPVGVLIRLYGNATVPRLRNLTTGEVLEIGGNIPSTTYAEIDTHFGRKAVDIVDANGARTRLMYRLNLARADFWQIQPGVNTIRFEADVLSPEARATITWRPEISGL